MLKIFCDQDEVLADFRSAACRIHGRSREEADRLCKQTGEWHMAKTWGMSEEEFWKPITAAGAGFWFGLQPLPWCQDLVGLIERYDPHWYVATSPSQCPSCFVGKHQWLHKHIHPEFDRWFPSRYKHELAGPGKILIDDRPKTIQAWREHGGQGILFPSCGNELNHLAANPLEYVRQQLDLLDYALDQGTSHGAPASGKRQRCLSVDC
jgi:hypothetical protein